MKKIIILIGPPAGGKTEIAFRLARILPKAKAIEVDKIKEQISGSVHGKDDTERELWFKALNNKIKNLLIKYDNIIVDEGFFKQEYLRKFLKGLEKFKIIIVEISYSLEEHFKRDKKRKGDEPSAVKKMYKLHNSVVGKEKIKPDIIIKDKDLTVDQVISLIYKKLF